MTKIVAIDTEFERKHTYRPILSIVQIREENKDPVIYDVYKKENEKLIDLLEILANDDIVKIIHSARQDVEAIFYRFHIEMHNIFDTQIAYKYIYNENEIGYAKIVQNICKTEIIKEKTLQKSNWLHRPLTKEQFFYAKQDVLYLHEIYSKMIEIFKKNEQLYIQFKNECWILEDEKNYSFNTQHIWQKMKHKFINDINRNMIKDMIICREKLAYKANIPREFAIKTNNLLNFAHTGNISFLKTHHKIDKKVFINLYKKYK